MGQTFFRDVLEDLHRMETDDWNWNGEEEDYILMTQCDLQQIVHIRNIAIGISKREAICRFILYYKYETELYKRDDDALFPLMIVNMTDTKKIKCI